jgi:hypothetical protein
VHHFYVYIPWVFGVSLPKIEVRKYLVPELLFHKMVFSNKVTKKNWRKKRVIGKRNYICSPCGELAHLVERLHGMQKVTGSTPVFSTKPEILNLRYFRFFIYPKTMAFFQPYLIITKNRKLCPESIMTL